MNNFQGQTTFRWSVRAPISTESFSLGSKVCRNKIPGTALLKYPISSTEKTSDVPLSKQSMTQARTLMYRYSNSVYWALGWVFTYISPEKTFMTGIMIGKNHPCSLDGSLPKLLNTW